MPSTASDCRLTDNMKQLTPIICLPHIHFDKPIHALGGGRCTSVLEGNTGYHHHYHSQSDPSKASH